jgi:hypothetical protein
MPILADARPAPVKKNKKNAPELRGQVSHALLPKQYVLTPKHSGNRGQANFVVSQP